MIRIVSSSLPLTYGDDYLTFQNNQLNNFSFVTTTHNSPFAVCSSLFANCFFANSDLRSANDDPRYSKPYQPFYFYDYGEEDFSRLKNNLTRIQPSLYEQTQLQISHLLYLVDRILWHGSYDSKDVYFAQKVSSLAFALNEMASHQGTNTQFLGLIDPMLVVPDYSADNLYDLDRFNSFWNFLDKVLQGDFNSKSPEEIIKELDAALVADLGNKPRFLDEPTRDVLRAVLRRLKDKLPSDSACEVIDTIEQALFWAYNASQPSEKALHSQFNPNPFYARPPKVLMNVLSVDNLRTIINITPASEVRYNGHLGSLSQSLAALHYAIVDFGEEVDLTTYTRDQWNDLTALKILRSVYPELAKQAIEVNRNYPEPFFGIPQEELAQRLAFLQKRLEERIAEIEGDGGS